MAKKDIIWHVEKRKVSELKPHPDNARIFTEKGMKDLNRSIKSIGMAQPVNITPDGVILSGHARVMALKEQGIDEVDVYIPNRELTEKEQHEVLIRMNANIAGIFDWDKAANIYEMDDLTDWGLEIPDLEVKGEEKEVVEDEVPKEVETRCKRGDIWKLGEHRLMCGDSTVITDVEKLMNGKKADMVFTDPPYGVSYEGGKKGKHYPHTQRARVGICPVCSKEYRATGDFKDRRQIYCSHDCYMRSRLETTPEKIMRELLDKISVEYKQEYKIGKYWADFYLPKYNAVIEFDGDYWHSLPDVKEKDTRKDIFLKSKGINVMHIKECELKTGDVIIQRWENLTGKTAEKIN